MPLTPTGFSVGPKNNPAHSRYDRITADSINPWNNAIPSVDPIAGSADRSGWGIIPKTLPLALQIPADRKSVV